MHIMHEQTTKELVYELRTGATHTLLMCKLVVYLNSAENFENIPCAYVCRQCHL